MAEIKCPMCGKPNPDDLDACQFCEARLKPVTDELSRSQPPIHVGDEPTKKDTAELEPVLPKWLREVRQQARESVEEQDEEQEQQEPVGAGDQHEDLLAGLQSDIEEDEIVPDWLSNLHGGEPSEIQDAIEISEDRLRAISGDAESSNSDMGTGDRLPGWASHPDAAQETREGGETLGDWLAREVGKEKAQEAGEKAPEESRAGFGLRGDAETDLSFQGESVDESAQFEGEIPSWLRVDENDATSEGGIGTKPLEEPAYREAPEDVQVGESAQDEPVDAMPDWLSSLGEETDGHQAGGDETVAGNGQAVKDDQGPPGAESELSFGASRPESSDEDEIPAWLAQMGEEEHQDEAVHSASEAGPEERIPRPAVQPEADEGWQDLSEVKPFALEQDVVPNEAADGSALLGEEDGAGPGEDVDALFSIEMPDWLSAVEQSAGPQASPEPEADSEVIRPAELPSWVQAMRPVEAFVSGEGAGGERSDTEQKGPLAGLSGVLPLVPGVGPSSKPKTYSIKLQASEDQLASAEQLEQLLEAESYPRPAIPRPGLPAQRWLRMTIFALLLIVVGFFLFAGTSVMYIPLSVTAGTAQALNIVREELLPDAAVLMVFDYQAAFAPELEASAAPLVDHMMLLKHPRLTLLASKPSATGLSERFMHNTQPGQSYVNLGYLPGDAAGALAFVENPRSAKPAIVDGQSQWETPALQGVTLVSDFAAIFLLTDEADTARIWIEQLHNRRGATRLVLISSSQAGPLLVPYMESGQIDGLVVGLEGGAPIEKVNSNRPGTVRRYWDAYGFGLIITITMIVAGSFWNLFSGWQANRKKTGEK